MSDRILHQNFHLIRLCSLLVRSMFVFNYEVALHIEEEEIAISIPVAIVIRSSLVQRKSHRSITTTRTDVPAAAPQANVDRNDLQMLPCFSFLLRIKCSELHGALSLSSNLLKRIA